MTKMDKKVNVPGDEPDLFRIQMVRLLADPKVIPRSVTSTRDLKGRITYTIEVRQEPTKP